MIDFFVIFLCMKDKGKLRSKSILENSRGVSID